MEYVLRLTTNIVDIPFTFFSEDDDTTTEEEDGSLDGELGSLESDDDPGIEWRNDGEYEE